MARLDGRVAILTGGAKGIGVTMPTRSPPKGARLMIADIADGSEVAAALAREHGANSVVSSITDVSDEGAVKALVADTMERFGKIDIARQQRRAVRAAVGDQVHRDRRRGVGSRDGDQSARTVSAW